MIELNVEQRHAVRQQADGLVRALDPDTQTTYVLLKEDVYDRVMGLLSEDGDSLFLENMHGGVMEVFGKAGWDDPAMDVYDELDPRRQP